MNSTVEKKIWVHPSLFITLFLVSIGMFWLNHAIKGQFYEGVIEFYGHFPIVNDLTFSYYSFVKSKGIRI